MVPVIAEFILHKEDDQHTACHTDGQAQYIDHRIPCVLAEISHGDGEIVFEHIGVTRCIVPGSALLYKYKDIISAYAVY